MTQSDLFDTHTRRGDSIVPPTREEIARHKRDRGIERAVTHADAIDPTWLKRAVGYVKEYAALHAQFLGEDVREFAERSGFPAPPDGRAYGAVMRRAARDGFIKRIGYAPAKSSNLSPKVLWGRA